MTFPRGPFAGGRFLGFFRKRPLQVPSTGARGASIDTPSASEGQAPGSNRAPSASAGSSSRATRSTKKRSGNRKCERTPILSTRAFPARRGAFQPRSGANPANVAIWHTGWGVSRVAGSWGSAPVPEVYRFSARMTCSLGGHGEVRGPPPGPPPRPHPGIGRGARVAPQQGPILRTDMRYSPLIQRPDQLHFFSFFCSGFCPGFGSGLPPRSCSSIARYSAASARLRPGT